MSLDSRQFLEAKAQAQGFALLGEVSDTVAGEHVEERGQSFVQRAAQIASASEGAMKIAAALKTFRHGEVLFGEPDGVEQGDLRGRPAEPDATFAAAHRLDQ